ncbi:hypothetical protein AR457_02980 [Streptomyces agglomeratus]|uniref:Uncharacterized protein n=1 Tax=Streptomyces agglomeratus TaxID=285458 RepID=A0A1E5P259_9ACTN|nr:hypothetical protein [Streptomyces agglomeratus]OEJ23616.1 hypothetical protein AS594_03085 [Streptomyces agglomeratus]OEJ43210.1 hypothetical protein AR457_02980 [Streptomyces agglomeratus]OEJ54869.1 hypothetical protein BGK72_32790 [Streptomyces agglomeratus]
MGDWVFTPAVGHPIWGPNATLHDKDRCVELRYSASLLEELLARLGSIEAGFATTSGAPDARTGGHPGRRPFHG